jgi:hypothetical protein
MCRLFSIWLTHPKSRHTDWALNYYFDSHLFVDTKMKPIRLRFGYSHTKGKIKGKTIDDFFTEGSLVNNHKVQPNELNYRDPAGNAGLTRTG